MKIELREKIQTTQKEFNSVNQNDRPSLSETLFKKSNHSKAIFDSSTGEVTEELI